MRFSLFITFTAALLLLTPTAEGNHAAWHIIGTSGPDVLNGTRGGDHIEGKEGGDLISARPGADDVFCGKGNDRCYGGRGSDAVVGGDGADRIYAGCNGGCVENPAASNDLFGGSGGDTLGADNGVSDDVNGADGSDTCFVDLIDDWANCELCRVDGSSPRAC